MIIEMSLEKALIKNLFTDVLMAPELDVSLIVQYVDPSYIQKVDGVELDYDSFVNHIEAQKKVISKLDVNFLTLVQEGNVVFSNHIVTAHKKDGSIIKVKVIAQFTIHNNRLVLCDELTRLIEGGGEDHDIGSRH